MGSRGFFFLVSPSVKQGQTAIAVDNAIRDHVAGSVMAYVIKTLNPDVLDVDNQILYWEHIKISAANIRKAGGTPTLLVAGRADPRWLLDWTRSAYNESIISILRFSLKFCTAIE